MSNVQDNAAHTCSYSCDRPQCVKAQRDELAAATAQDAVAKVGSDHFRSIVDWLGPIPPPNTLLYAAPVTAAPTLDDELAQDRMSELCKLESDVLDVLPSVYYMDPPDGGDVSLGEQVKRMAEDAANWRKHANTPAAPGIDLLSELVAAIKSYRLSASTTNRESIERLDDILAGIERSDASPKGGSEARDAARYRWLRDRKFSFSHDEESRGIAGARWGEWPYDTDEGHAAVMDAAIDAAMQAQASDAEVRP